MARFWRKHSEFQDERTARRIANELRALNKEDDLNEREDVVVRKVYYWRILTAPRRQRSRKEAK